MSYKDLHREDPDVSKKIVALLRLGLFDHAEIVSIENYKLFEFKEIVYSDVIYTRVHATTWNGALDSLPTHLTPRKNEKLLK